MPQTNVKTNAKTNIKNILVLDRYPLQSLAPLNEAELNVTSHDKPQVNADLMEKAHGLLIRSRTLVNANFLKHCKDLKVIVTATSGFDHIDLEACKEKNIAVFYTPEANAQSAAELALHLILGCLRQSTRVQQIMTDKLWKDQLSPGQELFDKTLGLVGYGRVGKKVALLAQAFGAHVKFYDPYVDSEPEKNIFKTDMTELLNSSDIVSMHVPLTHETKNIMHANNLSEMSSDAFLINTSRGEVICETSLINALGEGALAGAGLDVFAREPLPADSKLRSLKNVIITPHIGALTEQALHRASNLAVKKLLDFVTSGDSHDALPNGVHWYRAK